MFDLMVVSDVVRKRMQEAVNVEQERTSRGRDRRHRVRRLLALPGARLATRRRERLQEPCAEAPAR
jgi:hypothetical protein